MMNSSFCWDPLCNNNNDDIIIIYYIIIMHLLLYNNNNNNNANHNNESLTLYKTQWFPNCGTTVLITLEYFRSHRFGIIKWDYCRVRFSWTSLDFGLWPAVTRWWSCISFLFGLISKTPLGCAAQSWSRSDGGVHFCDDDTNTPTRVTFTAVSWAVGFSVCTSTMKSNWIK